MDVLISECRKVSFTAIITNYEDTKEYPAIYYIGTEDGKKVNAHLRGKIANILWYGKDESRASRRSDASIAERIKRSEKIAGTVYFRKKK